MTPQSGISKICVICGQDCSNRPRTKDPAGRYFCQPCYDQARGHGKPESTARTSSDSPSDDLGILNQLLDEIKPPPVASTMLCSHCGRQMSQQAVVCTHCGYDTRSGRQLKVVRRTDHSQRESPVWLWPVDLLFRPGRFFSVVASKISPAMMAVVIWIFGMSRFSGQLSLRRSMMELRGQEWILPDSWAVHWIVVALGGAFFGLIGSRIGGWWFRVRLGWSGDHDADPAIARGVFVLAWLVFDVPALLLDLLETLVHASPTAAFESDFSLLYLLAVPTLFWSIWTSYAGARTLFKTERLRAVLWFIVLPALWFGLQFVGAVVVLVLLAGPLSKPDVRQPRFHQGGRVVFSYPGNWNIDTGDPDYDPNGDLFIEAPLASALVHITAYWSDDTPQEELRLSFNNAWTLVANASESDSFTHWGKYDGIGRTIVGRMDGRQVVVRIFVSQMPNDQILKVNETYPVSARETVDPGLKLIQSTLSLR